MATAPSASRILAWLVFLLSVPTGMLVGRTVDPYVGWHPAPPPPRPPYLATASVHASQPAAGTVERPKHAARHASVQAAPPGADPDAPLAVRKLFASPSSHSDWTTYGAAMEESKRTGKPVMIDFYADWCPPCQMLKSQVFEDPALLAQVEKVVIPVSIVDRERERGFNSDETQELQNLYRADAFPTLIVVSARTGMMTRVQGFLGADETVTWIRESARALR